LKKERALLEELRGQLRTAEGEVKQATTQAGAVKTELDQIRATATSLTQDYGRIRETSREAREDTAAAMTTVKDIEKKLVPLAQLHELSQSTEKRLAGLNVLAEHVSRKAKALESQQQAVEHAVVRPTASTRWSGPWTSRSAPNEGRSGRESRGNDRPHRCCQPTPPSG
jgi:uncharacterized protein (DUF3084 family)